MKEMPSKVSKLRTWWDIPMWWDVSKLTMYALRTFSFSAHAGMPTPSFTYHMHAVCCCFVCTRTLIVQCRLLRSRHGYLCIVSLHCVRHAFPLALNLIPIRCRVCNVLGADPAGAVEGCPMVVENNTSGNRRNSCTHTHSVRLRHCDKAYTMCL